MTRPASAGMLAHFASPRLTIAVMCEATRTDGVVFGFTDCQFDLPYSSLLYKAGSLGFTMSAAEISDTTSADNHEIKGSLTSDGITRFDILAGRWDSCQLRFFLVNYRSLGAGASPEAFGTLGNVSLGELGFTVEFLDLKQRLQQNILRTVSPMCDAILGDARCGVDLTPFTETLTVGVSPAPTDRTATDAARTEADGWWNDGNAEILTSSTPEAVGLKMEIKSSTAAGAFEFVLPFFYGLPVGTTLKITPGCNKQKRLADGTFGGDCVVKFHNARRFRGCDAVPGQDKATQYGES